MHQMEWKADITLTLLVREVTLNLSQMEWNTLLYDIPDTYDDDVSGKESKLWLKAMNKEIQSMHGNQTWRLVPKPNNVKAIDCKWIFRIKEGNDSGEPPRFKARLVAKGFSQREGIDFNDIFAPVVKYKTMRLLLAMTDVFNLEFEQMDIKTAFLHGNLDEILYMKQPKGFIDK
ncbi:unnamed protein product [Rhodiola kirilowii]